MNQRERNDLDRHITGNGGEDQFKEQPEDVNDAPPDEPEERSMTTPRREPPSDDRSVLVWHDKAYPPVIGYYAANLRRWSWLGCMHADAEALWWTDIPQPFVPSVDAGLLAAAKEVFAYFNYRLDHAVAILPHGEDKARRILAAAIAAAEREAK